ncbi:MAG: 50S ribosomal protein L19 [Bacillota bacterium]
MDLLGMVEKDYQKNALPDLNPGAVVRIHVKVKEGNRERIQVFEGTIIAKKGGGLKETFIVRKVSQGVGVERTFPVHSPSIEKIEVVKEGRIKRAKLYYLRKRSGKSARIVEKRAAAAEADIEE